MYAFSILTDEHVPLNFFSAERLFPKYFIMANHRYIFNNEHVMNFEYYIHCHVYKYLEIIT